MDPIADLITGKVQNLTAKDVWIRIKKWIDFCKGYMKKISTEEVPKEL